MQQFFIITVRYERGRYNNENIFKLNKERTVGKRTVYYHVKPMNEEEAMEKGSQNFNKS